MDSISLIVVSLVVAICIGIVISISNKGKVEKQDITIKKSIDKEIEEKEIKPKKAAKEILKEKEKKVVQNHALFERLLKGLII